MKKLFYFVLSAFAIMAVGCTKENEDQKPDNNQQGTSDVWVVGTWKLHHNDDFETLTMDANNVYTVLQAMYKEEGTYTFANNAITFTPTAAWTRDYLRDEHSNPILDEHQNYQYSDWTETSPHDGVRTLPVKKLYDGEVMLLQIQNYDGPEWALYVNENATHVSNIGDIQGKWYWLMSEHGAPRVIVKVEGNQGDVIICPYEERYVGTIRYEKGVIYMDNPTYYTTRYEDGEGGWNHMNEEDPENSPWLIPNEDYNFWRGTFEGGLSLGFVADGDKAYGGVANLNATFYKQ